MRFLILLTIACALKGQSQGTVKADAAPTGSVQNGKKIFTKYGCYECHGYQAQGGVAGPRLGPRPIQFSRFSAYIRQPAGQMPPYTRKVVSDQEVADIFAFVESVPQP
jgi:mono/diheme cytochrome c family protein